jgi:transposase
LLTIRPARTVIRSTSAYRERKLIERMLSRLKNWRRIATRFDKPAPYFAATLGAATLWQT